MRIAHLADLHLGFRQFDRQTARGMNQREADVAEAFRRAVDDVIAQRPDLILLAGDVFHSVRPTNPAILFLFKELQRIKLELPDAPIVMIAGDHDTPRSVETGTILKLYEVLGVETVVDRPRRVVFPKLDCAVLAVPHQALVQAERPAFRPERGGPTYNILLLHGQHPNLAGPDELPLDFGGAVITTHDLAPAQWDYVGLGHYHVALEVVANAWYAGSLDYVGPNPWRELREQAVHTRSGKGYLLVELPAARVSFRPVAAARRFVDLPPVDGAGLTAKELDARIAERVAKADPPIDEQVVRLLAYNVSRGTFRDLDHAAIRGFKARALNFNLDVRRPVVHRQVGTGAPGRGQTLAETVRDFLGRRPLDADVDRGEFVRLGVEYLERVALEERGGRGGGP